MHLPDGFLNLPTASASAILSAGGVSVAAAAARRSLTTRRVPLVGMVSAFIFVAQMINFPVAGGTSGHLVGAVLAAVLVGPAAAVLVMSSVLLLQCFLFADGGVTALGANIFNMGLVAPVLGYAVYAGVRRLAGESLRGRLVAATLAAWCSIGAASVACAGELALSGTVPWGAVFPAMTAVHLVIGVGEAAITLLVLTAVARLRPELLAGPSREPGRRRIVEAAAFGLVVSVGLALFVVPNACGWPDGLERVASELGFAGRAAGTGPAAGHTPAPGTGPTPAIRTAPAAVAGTLAAFLLAWMAAGLARPGFRVFRKGPPAVRLVAAMAAVVGIVLIAPGAWPAFAAVTLGLAALTWAGGLGPGRVVRRILMLEPFVLGVAALTFLRPGGVEAGLFLLARSTLCLWCMVLLSLSTPMGEIQGALRRLGAPRLVVMTVSLTWRYVFLLRDELERMRRARRCRTLHAGRWREWRSLASVIGLLFVRSTERAERVHAAMCARGWKA